MKHMVPQTLEWAETAPMRVVESIVLDASPARVWDVVADHEAWPNWFTSVKKVERLGSGTGVGGRRRVHLPGRVVVDEVFIAWEPERRFAFTLTHSRPRLVESMVEIVDLEDLADGRTRLTYTQAVSGNALVSRLTPVLEKRFAKGLADGLQGLAAAVA